MISFCENLKSWTHKIRGLKGDHQHGRIRKLLHILHNISVKQDEKVLEICSTAISLQLVIWHCTVNCSNDVGHGLCSWWSFFKTIFLINWWKLVTWYNVVLSLGFGKFQKWTVLDGGISRACVLSKLWWGIQGNWKIGEMRPEGQRSG